MKTLTCTQLGGSCGAKLSAGSWDEMVQAMHAEDPKKWAKENKPKWENAKETSDHASA
jgi:hypothetical protein